MNVNTMRRPMPDAFRARLSARFGEQFSTSTGVLKDHGHGEGDVDVVPPDGVVFPRTSQDVADLARMCNDARIPLIAFGSGSSLEGQLLAVQGGISVDLSGMNTVLEVNVEDLDCRVQAGVTREQLNHALRGQGLMFPLDPGYDASLGGMLSTRASGTNAVRYGTMREVTLGATMVSADGQIIRTGGRARKSSAGYDLTRLLVGSEGTLGIITEIQLKLFGIPECISSGVAQFDSLGDTVNSVIQIMQLGVPVARIELLDALQMKACIQWSKLSGFEDKPTLFFEFHGSEASVADNVAVVETVISEHGAGEFRWANRQEERNRLWTARHNAYHAARSLKPGCESVTTDACVPISQLANCIRGCREMADESGLICPIVGHVGDGNFHALILFDPALSGERAAALSLAKSIGRQAIACGGSCTGEHGIGINKMALLEEECGLALPLMRQIKRAFDPNNILNPGKIFTL